MLNDRPVWATIPTIAHSTLLFPLLNKLGHDPAVDKVLLTVNLEGSVSKVRDVLPFVEDNVDVFETWLLGRSLHHGWNTAIRLAREANAWLAVLNDDILLPGRNPISDVVSLLETNPSYAVMGLDWQNVSVPGRIRTVSGSYRHSGVGGFAWVCDPHKVELVPEDLVHWGGDDYIFFKAMDAGYKLGVDTKTKVEHPHPETTASGQPWTYEARIKDREVFEKYYPGRGW